jgi:hypothetical protein
MDFITETLIDPLKTGIVALAVGFGGFSATCVFLSMKTDLTFQKTLPPAMAGICSIGLASYGIWSIYDGLTKRD